MNYVDLTFADVNEINPVDVCTYLHDTGWREDSRLDTRAVIFTARKYHETYWILLPIDREIPDFCSRMYDVLRTLEAVECRHKSKIIDSFKRI